MLKRIFSKKTFRQLCLVVSDIFIIMACSYFSLILRFDVFSIPSVYYNLAKNNIIFDLLIVVSVFSLFKLYSSLWKYASITELVNIFSASILVSLVEYSYKTIFNIRMPLSYHFINFILMLLFIGASRLLYRTFRYFKENIKDRPNGGIKTMVIGAGEAGNTVIKEIKHNRKINNKVVCAIDDDINKKNRYILGVPIVGSRKDIIKYAEKYHIQEIFIAIPSASADAIKEVIEICQKTDCKLKILPFIHELDGHIKFRHLRDVRYEDLLGRESIRIEDNEVKTFISNKTIIVTGGGGSIGSELCRQIAIMNPKKLIIVDIYENNAYDIQMELTSKYPELDLQVLIASVRDIDRMDNIFKKHRPDIVYHAAAHKHVPLMEESPNEAIKNNCEGTLNVVKLADKYKVDKFVLISTDKAVRPTNVMGASKRICEMIIQNYNKRSKTDYVAVRFGNVLGSNGSVIPLFLKQIEEGGPVTVTHKKITRFFMTIPEAVLLVLQAGLYATGGEIFILDMGSPVNIYDLANDLIKLKGYIPGKDIEIKITGLRPGEKLYEEILMKEEGLQGTPNKLIFIGRPIEMNDRIFLTRLDKLIKAANENSEDIKNMIANLVGTYTVTDNAKEKELVR